ncbi:helix-turn-helix domain-containing protein [bacterium]|nr:helix-turn-helix domain-containing protein [bacterium]
MISAPSSVTELGILYFKEACLFINIKPSRMRHLIFTKKIPVKRMGRTIYFFKSDLIEWIKNPNKELIYE